MLEENLAVVIAKTLYEKKAGDIVVLKVGHLTWVTDYLVVATAENAIQGRALAEALEKSLAPKHIWPRRREGFSAGRWIVLDFSSVIVHIFDPENRAYYHLERLWQDGNNRLALPFDGETDERM